MGRPGPGRRLGVSTRTLRRDVESLRGLGYPVHAVKGPDGGYRLGPGSKLPPLLLDDDQAIAVAVALQTAPTSVSGIDDAVARALTSIKQVMPARLRAEADAMHLTAIRNWWEFAAPPISSETLRAVGYAVRNDSPAALRLPHPRRSPPAPARRRLHSAGSGRASSPGHLGRTLVPRRLCPGGPGMAVYRVDRIHPYAPSGARFARRELPEPNVARYVMTSWDRGDTPAPWQCLGTVLIDLPPHLVARWAPGGSVVEYVSPNRTRLTVGAWSWAGVAGILATFDTDITILEPDELRDACGNLAQRYRRASD